jgi:hypothetical protein
MSRDISIYYDEKKTEILDTKSYRSNPLEKHVST